MFSQATNDHYEALREELKNNNKPGVWVAQMCRKLETENPAIAEFLYRLLEKFPDRPWFVDAVHCACAMYRLLELAADTLPQVNPEVGAPMQVEMLREGKQFYLTWARRIQTENPRALSVIADYVMEFVCRGGTKQDAAYVSWAGLTVYQYLARQAEADELE